MDPATSLVRRLPRFTDGRGELSFFEPGQPLPFSIGWVGWLYTGQGAGHTLPAPHGPAAVVCLAGSICLGAGRHGSGVTLDRPDAALLSSDAASLRIEAASADACVLICTESGPVPAVGCDVAAMSPRPLPSRATAAGLLVEPQNLLPFRVQRLYYLYNVPASQQRGAHAHRSLRQLIVAVRGSFDVDLEGHSRQRRVHLSDGRVGLFVEQMTWRDLRSFSPDAVCLVLASARYDEADYIRDRAEYLRLVARADGAALCGRQTPADGAETTRTELSQRGDAE